jgi:hypothetical protein
MPASPADCLIFTIPVRLHSDGRGAVPSIDPRDWLYMRHPPLARGIGYGSKIPGHDKLGDQSANSRLLNKSCGSPTDVLYDTADGNHLWTWGIAGFSVRQITQLSLPNPNTAFRRVHGQPIPPDVYSFRVRHSPMPCMYPHCEIYAFKNNTERLHDIRNSMRTTIRRQFAQMADRNRWTVRFQCWSASLKRSGLKLFRDIDALSTPRAVPPSAT